jgi:hypothetical protein
MFSKHLTGLTDDIIAVAKSISEAKDEQFVIPEEITKEDQSDFVVAAAAAKKAGKKKFTFKGKEFPVTIKTDIPVDESQDGPYDEQEVEVVDKLKEETEVVSEEFKPCGGCKTPDKCMAEQKCLAKSEEEDKEEKGKKKDKVKNDIDTEPTLDEQFEEELVEANKKDIAKAIEIAMDNEGAMTKAVKMIEKIKKGLSKHKDVQAALRIANEEKEK